VTQTCLFEEDSSSLEPRAYVPEAVDVMPLEEAHQDTSSLSSLAMDNISLPDNMSGGHITGNMVMSPEGMQRGSKRGLTDDIRSLEGTALSGVNFFFKAYNVNNIYLNHFFLPISLSLESASHTLKQF
jgi:hypothetical protein